MYAWAGVEYGRECWCGDVLNLGVGAGNRSDSDCDFVCPGDGGEFCGAGGMMSLYSRSR